MDKPAETKKFTAQTVEKEKSYYYSDEDLKDTIIYETSSIRVAIAPDAPIILTKFKKCESYVYSNTRLDFFVEADEAFLDGMISEKELLRATDVVNDLAKNIPLVDLSSIY